MAVQSYWSNVPVSTLQAPQTNSSAALAINAWDQIGKSISGLGAALGDAKKSLIEDPATRAYLQGINTGMDPSQLDYRNVSTDILKDTGQLMGQRIQNDANKFNLAVNQAKENNLTENQALISEAKAAYLAGDFKRAKALQDQASKVLRADIFKEYMDNLRAGERADAELDIARSNNALAWKDYGLRAQAINDTNMALEGLGMLHQAAAGMDDSTRTEFTDFILNSTGSDSDIEKYLGERTAQNDALWKTFRNAYDTLNKKYMPYVLKHLARKGALSTQNMIGGYNGDSTPYAPIRNRNIDKKPPVNVVNGAQ